MRSNYFLVSVLCLILCVASCSTRPYKMKRAERLYRQGQVCLAKGDEEAAMKKFQDSMELAKLADFKAGIAHNQNEMAIVFTSRREYDKARELLSQSLEIYQELHMAPEISKTLNNIALTYLGERKFEDTLSRYEELLVWDKDNNNDLGVGVTLFNMGMLYQNYLGQLEEAGKNYREALQVFKRIGNQEYQQLVEQKIATIP